MYYLFNANPLSHYDFTPNAVGNKTNAAAFRAEMTFTFFTLPHTHTHTHTHTHSLTHSLLHEKLSSFETIVGPYFLSIFHIVHYTRFTKS